MAAPPFLPGCLPRKRMLVIGEKGDEVRETASDDAFELYLLANPKAAEREEKRGRPRKDDAGLHVSRESEGEEGRDGKGKDGRTVQAERIGRVLRELYAANLHLDTIRHVIWRVLGPDLPNSPLADRRDLGVVGVVEPPLLAEDAGVQALAAVVQRHRTTLLDCSARLRDTHARVGRELRRDVHFMEQVAELRKRWDVRLRAGGQQLYVRLGFGPTPPMLGIVPTVSLLMGPSGNIHLSPAETLMRPPFVETAAGERHRDGHGGGWRVPGSVPAFVAKEGRPRECANAAEASDALRQIQNGLVLGMLADRVLREDAAGVGQLGAERAFWEPQPGDGDESDEEGRESAGIGAFGSAGRSAGARHGWRASGERTAAANAVTGAAVLEAMSLPALHVRVGLDATAQGKAESVTSTAFESSGERAAIARWLDGVSRDPAKRAWLRAEGIRALVAFVAHETDAGVLAARLQRQVLAASASAMPGQRRGMAPPASPQPSRGSAQTAARVRGLRDKEGLPAFLMQVVDVPAAPVSDPTGRAGQVSVLGVLRCKLASAACAFVATDV